MNDLPFLLLISDRPTFSSFPFHFFSILSSGTLSGFDSLGAALPPIPEDNAGRELLLKLAEAEGKKAEAEGKKAEAEGKKAEARKAEVELKILELKLPVKATFKAVIKSDALGLKTKLAEKMKEFNVAGTIARLPRPDGSSEYDTELIFVGTNPNVEKMKIFLRGGGEFGTTRVKSIEFEDFNDILISQTPSDFRRSSSSGGKETLFQIDPYETSTKKSESSKTSRHSGVQQEFTSTLLLRDFKGNTEIATCLVCDKRKSVEGAHIYPLNQPRSISLFAASNLNNSNDVRNGILLCHTCHGHFDDGMCGFDDNWCVTIEEALRQHPDYKDLGGRPTKVGDGPESPLKCLMQVQQYFCKKKRGERHEKVDTFEFSCSQCNKFWKTESGKTNHNCKPMPKPLLFTPPEKRRLGKGGVLEVEEHASGELEEVELEDSYLGLEKDAKENSETGRVP